jgi:hypothetical protein
MRLLRKSLLFAGEVAFLFTGFIFAGALAEYLYSMGVRFTLFIFLLTFSMFAFPIGWFHRRASTWTAQADADAWLAHRSWQRLHPSGAKRLRLLNRFFLVGPSLCAAFVLCFLPAASHVVLSAKHLVSHYSFSTPLNWLVIKSGDGGFAWTYFSNQGAARYGFTPVWFNNRMPSGATFLFSLPMLPSEWWRPAHERASGRFTHVGVKQFQLGTISAVCYEYIHNYPDDVGSSSIFEPPVLWESLCSTRPNSSDYNLRAAFLGHPEDLPAFYSVFSSARPSK